MEREGTCAAVEAQCFDPRIFQKCLWPRCNAWQSIKLGLVARGDRQGKAPCDGTFRIELLTNLRSYLIKETTSESSTKT